jgi:hypothetical protein
MTAICPYRIKLIAITRKVMGVAIPNTLIDEK